MPIGRARCKECNTLVEHEVEEDVECPGCGRVFQIPNAPQYVKPAARFRNRSISSIPFNLNIILGNVAGHREETNNWQVTKPQKQRIPNVSVSPFPEESEPEIMEDEGKILVVVEFPAHNISEIGWDITDDVLTLTSTRYTGYTNTIQLPANKGHTSVELRNGIFSMELKK